MTLDRLGRAWPWIAGGAVVGAAQGLAVGLGAWWAVWLIWGAVQFGVIEAYALILSRRARRAGLVDPRDTLSEHVWAWFGINVDGYGIDHDVSGPARFRRVLLGAFVLWFAVHMTTGGEWA